MTYELTAQKVAEHQMLSLDIPPGTNLPPHIDDYTIDVGTHSPDGHYVKVYLSEAAAMDDRGIIFYVNDRADFVEFYRLARMMRPGGWAHGGAA